MSRRKVELGWVVVNKNRQIEVELEREACWIFNKQISRKVFLEEYGEMFAIASLKITEEEGPSELLPIMVLANFDYQQSDDLCDKIVGQGHIWIEADFSAALAIPVPILLDRLGQQALGSGRISQVEKNDDRVGARPTHNFAVAVTPDVVFIFRLQTRDPEDPDIFSSLALPDYSSKQAWQTVTKNKILSEARNDFLQATGMVIPSIPVLSERYMELVHNRAKRIHEASEIIDKINLRPFMD